MAAATDKITGNSLPRGGRIPVVAGTSKPPVVAVIGGGFTGAATAYHLAALGVAPVRIVVYEPRAILGAGLAYDTDEPVHRINVPAERMTLVPGDGEHFYRWLRATGALSEDPRATVEGGHVFPRRSVFGRYVAAQLEPLLADGTVAHRRTRVSIVTRLGNGTWKVEAEDGSVIVADVVVVATTHPSPQAPGVVGRALAGHPRYVPDATIPGALSAVRQGDRVLVVGTGLTAADVIAALDASGHAGDITAISRRGLRSRGHNLLPQEPFGEFAAVPVRSARALLRLVRQTVWEAAEHGVTWHAVFDRLRTQGGDIWRALPDTERRRLVRFLRPYWDVHRFRIAPQLENVIQHRLETGNLTVKAASIAAVRREKNDEIVVSLRPRHARDEIEVRYDAVIVTTGPGHRSILASQPFLGGLAAAGTLHADSVGLGIAVDEDSHPIGADGAPSRSLYIAGPLARGTFGELMGLPQVTEHAIFVAERVARDLRFSERASGEPRRQVG